jgi:hypothetical protein
MTDEKPELAPSTPSVATDEPPNHHQSTVQFQAQVHKTSKVLSYSSREDVEAFFTSPINRNLFLTAGGKHTYEQLELTPDLLDEWMAICQQNGTTVLPTKDDEVYTVQTSGMKMLGITIDVLITVGVKQIPGEDQESGSTFLVTLIRDRRRATGLRLFVYLYNKMTNDQASSSRTTSTTTIQYRLDTEKSQVIFELSTWLLIQMQFPKILMPMIGHDKLEAQGSQAVSKSIDDDSEQSMIAFETAYTTAFGQK